MEILEYFIDETNKRLERIERKVDKLMSLRAQILVVSALSSTLVSVVVALIR